VKMELMELPIALHLVATAAKEFLALAEVDIVALSEMEGAHFELCQTHLTITRTAGHQNKDKLRGPRVSSPSSLHCLFLYSLFNMFLADESTGIISTAIANAEKDSITPSRGQENLSLLQQASKKSSPASTQFTFTCDSQVPGTIAWPGPQPPPHNSMNQSPAARAINSHGTQTSPKTVSGTGQIPGLAGSQQAPHAAKQNGRPPAPEKKTRRRTGKEYLIAARQRRQAQEYQNYHHPPAPEDEWICEFCEYERIFGTPPEALIRQYEIKDRRIRKQEAERRRLLEKAKMKGRKGKKGTKMAPKNAATTHDRQAQQGSTHNQSHNQGHDQGTSEEYYEDEYDEEYPQNKPLPSPTIPHLAAGHDNVPHGSVKHGLVQGGVGTSEALVS
jgi:hypothetical protein